MLGLFYPYRYAYSTVNTFPGSVGAAFPAFKVYIVSYINNNNCEVLLAAIIHRPDAPLASQERKESEN